MTHGDRDDDGSGRVGIDEVGCVVIGRNEGTRLRTCLESLAGRVHPLVYVDSGSTDGSVELARQLGATVVDLDLTRPFTAARARNAGYRKLREADATVAFVQFVDGDCAVVGEWIERAARFLKENPEVAVACGRRRERHPEASVYNALCDVEWNTPPGEARSCGGDALMRATAFDAVGGFDGSLIAGEEPELCVRLRRAGFKIFRLPFEMTLHDAAIYRASQWWTRSVRAGYAYAQGYHMHGAPPERHCYRPVQRIAFWGVALPALIAVGFVPTGGMSSVLSLGYAASALRAYQTTRKKGSGVRISACYAVACTVGRFAELQGALRFLRGRWQGREGKLIEYKS